MYNIGAHDNHKLLSYHNNEPLQYNYHTIDIIVHHYCKNICDPYYEPTIVVHDE